MKNILYLIFFLLIIVVGTVFVSFSFYHDEVRLAERSTQWELKLITQAVANDIDYILSDSGRDLKFIASIVEDDSVPSSDKLNKIFNTFFSKNSYLISIWFMDANGIMRTVVPDKYKEEIGNDYSYRNYFKRAKLLKKSIYSKVLQNALVKGTEEKFECIVITVPYKNDKGEFYGLLGADIHTDKIQERILAEVLANSTTQTGLYLVDYKKSTLVAGPDQRHGVTQSFKNFIVSLADDKYFNSNNVALKTFNGKKYFFTKMMISNPEYEFNLIGAFPYDETMSFLPGFYMQTRWLLGFVSLVMILVIIFVIYNEKIRKQLQKKIQTLEIYIDQEGKKEALEGIINTSFYEELLEKAQDIKNKSC